MPVTIRKACDSDVDWLMGQLEEFSRFFGTKKASFDLEYARTAVPLVIQDHLFLVAEQDEERVGFIAGLVLPHLFNPNVRALHEMFWWILPEHRNTKTGSVLLDAFVAWGKENVDWIFFALQEKHLEPTPSLIARGFHLRERTYFYEVD